PLLASGLHACFFHYVSGDLITLHPFPTRRSSDLYDLVREQIHLIHLCIDAPFRKLGLARRLINAIQQKHAGRHGISLSCRRDYRSEEHTSELQSRENLVCRLLLEKKKIIEEQVHA